RFARGMNGGSDLSDDRSRAFRGLLPDQSLDEAGCLGLRQYSAARCCSRGFARVGQSDQGCRWRRQLCRRGCRTSRSRFSERQGEEPVFRAAFEQLKRDGLVTEIHDLPDGVFQEGAGDCIWDADRNFFWVGYGQRSTETSIAAIECVFGEKTVALELASPRFYHLDTCFCPLAGGHVLYYPPAFTP